jgi:hypothetical protein
MPGHTLPPGDIPASATPLIISQSETHVVLAVEIAKATLTGYRRLFEQLIEADDRWEVPR